MVLPITPEKGTIRNGKMINIMLCIFYNNNNYYYKPYIMMNPPD